MDKYKESFYNLYYKGKDKTIVYNLVSGVGAYVDDESLMAIKNGSASNAEKELQLAEFGFIVPYGVNEYLRLKEISLGEIWNASPKDLLFVIVPSMMCNLNCKYCFESYDIRRNNVPVMTDETREKVIKFVKQRIVSESKKQLKHVSLSFFGGEPTLYPEIITDISTSIRDFCEECGIVFDARIITNGVLLTKDIGLKLAAAGISKAQITLDGLKEDYANRKGVAEIVFDKVIKNICDNAELLKINIRVNVDNGNKDSIPELMKLLFDDFSLNGKITLYFAQIKNWGCDDKISFIEPSDYGIYLESYIKYAIENDWIDSILQKPPKTKFTSCGMIRAGSIGIGYDGSLYRCTHGFSNPEDCKIGDIETGLYANNYDYKFRNWTEDIKCSECKYFPVCWGGCRNNIILYNDYPNCELVKKETDTCILYSFKAKKNSTN